MKREHITEGTHINTIGGEIVITGTNGPIIFADEYEVNDNEELEYVGEGLYRAQEIADLMREYDGQNHTVVYYYAEDDAEEEE